jgi:PKD domain-containing protein/CHU domain-containing protein
MRYFLPVLCLLFTCRIHAQTQACPLNSNFSMGNMTYWSAYTGNNRQGNGPGAIVVRYGPTSPAPNGTLGTSVIYEYQLPSVPGIQVLSSTSNDLYGGFATVPNINGYQYTNSVLLGSTSITRAGGGGVTGGYVRGISYLINVPLTPAEQPYTMTYAYAMVLENGTHNSNQQPLFSATLSVNNTVISCASPKYFLPTSNNARTGGTGATLDTAIAESQGFSLSPRLSPNPDPNNNSPYAPHLQDVWTKGWTEVTFDLSPYRGQQVTLTFETDNCVPGGHFAYSYVALRNTCDGLIISGPSPACVGSTTTYSIPALNGATYQWAVPPGWTIVSGADSNILKVTVGSQGGNLSAQEVNSCANLKDDMNVITSPPTVAGEVISGTEVCSGNNSVALTLNGSVGNILTWLTSTDGINYSPLANTTTQYTAQNLTTTTSYRALVQNGGACNIDTSAAATILVDPKSVGGQLDPSSMDVCTGQFKDAALTLNGSTGNAVNWQSSTDNGATWADFNPAYTNKVFELVNLPVSTSYQVIIKSGVCPPAISSVASVNVLPGLFPQAVTSPADTPICYGTSATLNGTITLGTSYSWSPGIGLTNQGDGQINSLPYSIQATATPKDTTLYVLSILNAGCPNPLKDTFEVDVIAPILVNAGNDTSIVYNQPLQLNARSNNPTTVFVWTPVLGLSDPNIPDPVAVLGIGIDSIRYYVKAITPAGCFGEANILVKVFKTLPDIFLPNAFTPGKATNNIFRPIAVGIASLQYFRVFNRWGQLVYSTSQLGQGWDGYVNGHIQDPGTYVWMAQGKAYTGNNVFRKGTVILIR